MCNYKAKWKNIISAKFAFQWGDSELSNLLCQIQITDLKSTRPYKGSGAFSKIKRSRKFEIFQTDDFCAGVIIKYSE